MKRLARGTYIKRLKMNLSLEARYSRLRFDRSAKIQWSTLELRGRGFSRENGAVGEGKKNVVGVIIGNGSGGVENRGSVTQTPSFRVKRRIDVTDVRTCSPRATLLSSFHGLTSYAD